MTVPAKVLERLTPSLISDYLLENNFVASEKWGQFLRVYVSRIKGRDIGVVMPLSNDISDYANRLAAMINDLSVALDQPDYTILRDISNSGFEIVKFVVDENSHSNTLDYDSTMDVLQHGFRLIDASTVVELSSDPLRIIRGRRKDVIRQFLNNVRVGQTEVGSYVLPLLIPKNAPYVSEYLEKEEVDPFGVKVARRLAATLEIAKTAIASSSRSGPDELANAGLTANFAGGLANMVEKVTSVTIDVQVKSNAAKKADKRTKFTNRERGSLMAVERELTPHHKRRPIELLGAITQFTEAKNKNSGTVTLEAELFGQMRSVRASYDRDDRNTVIRAFEEKATTELLLNGILVDNNGKYSVEHVEKFSIKPKRLLT